MLIFLLTPKRETDPIWAFAFSVNSHCLDLFRVKGTLPGQQQSPPGKFRRAKGGGVHEGGIRNRPRGGRALRMYNLSNYNYCFFQNLSKGRNALAHKGVTTTMHFWMRDRERELRPCLAIRTHKKRGQNCHIS